MSVTIDHIGLSVSDFAAAKTFYSAALEPLGMSVLMEFPATFTGNTDVCGMGTDGRPFFWLAGGGRTNPHTHIAFQVDSRGLVDAFYAAALAAGAEEIMARLASARCITRTITARSCWTPTATISKRSATGTSRAEDRNMTGEEQQGLTGGCQCGAVRFRVEGVLGRASICHCRMCQKAFGSFYAPLVSTRGARLSWTRGEPKRFQSSNHVRRGFCAACGTPLTFEAPEDSLDGVALAIGAFDDPSDIVPIIQWGVEAKLPYVDTLHRLPRKETMEEAGQASYLDGLVSYQHPDHDTAVWRPR